MKKYFTSLSAICLMLLACLMSVSVTSCSSDDDPTPKPGDGGKSEATEAYVTPCVYIAEKLLKYCDVVLTDAGGRTYEISLSNTEVVKGNPTFGTFAKANALLFRRNVDMYGDSLRLFKLDKATYKSFPVTLTYTVTATANGTSPEATEKVPTFMTADVEMANDSDESLSGLNFSGSFSSTAYMGSKWNDFANSKYNPIKNTLKVTLESANSCSGSVG